MSSCHLHAFFVPSDITSGSWLSVGGFSLPGRMDEDGIVILMQRIWVGLTNGTLSELWFATSNSPLKMREVHGYALLVPYLPLLVAILACFADLASASTGCYTGSYGRRDVGLIIHQPMSVFNHLSSSATLYAATLYSLDLIAWTPCYGRVSEGRKAWQDRSAGIGPLRCLGFASSQVACRGRHWRQ